MQCIYIFNETILFMGVVPAIDNPRAPPVDTLSIGLDSEYHISNIDNGNDITAKTLYFPGAMARNSAYKKDAIISSLMFPKNLRIGKLIREKMDWHIHQGKVGSGIEKEQQWSDTMKWIFSEMPEPELVIAAFQKLLNVDANYDLFLPASALDERVELVKKAILKEILWDKKLNYNDISGVSRQHLGRLFRQCMGTSIKQYKTHMRMMLLAIIKEQGRNLTDSSCGVGFFDLSHSNRIHKKIYGVSQTHTLSNCRIKVHSSLTLESLYHYAQS